MLERLIASIDAEAKKQEIRDERYTREQRILDEQAPRAWKNLYSALKATSGKYPQHFTAGVRPESEVVIYGKNGRSLEVVYLSESKTVAYQCNGIQGELLIRLDEQNRAVICDVSGVSFPSIEAVAEELLALLLKKASTSSAKF